MPDQNTTQSINTNQTSEATPQTPGGTASDPIPTPTPVPVPAPIPPATPLMHPAAKAAAVSALSGDDKKSFAEQILAQTEKLAEAVVQSPPNYGAHGDGHLINDEKVKEEAMAGLEGAKWHEKRLENEARQKLEDQKQALLKEQQTAKEELEKLGREKEVFELQWVNLNDQKVPLDAELQAIIAEETRIEGEEKKKEQEEIAAETAEARKIVEDARWVIQQARHATEEQKWAAQDKVSTIAGAMSALSAKYQELLGQEDVRKRRIQEIDSDVKNL